MRYRSKPREGNVHLELEIARIELASRYLHFGFHICRTPHIPVMAKYIRFELMITERQSVVITPSLILRMVDLRGLEPRTFRLQGEYSPKLSYRPVKWSTWLDSNQRFPRPKRGALATGPQVVLFTL